MTPSNSDIVCFFHGNCVDGAAAAAVIKRKYPEAALYPMQHGDPIPVPVKGKKVFIVDFSFDEKTLKNLKKEAREAFWYDHHKTVLPIYESLKWGTIDLSESGATLTWKQEYPDQATPKILQYVKDKDIWEWKLPSSREVNLALREREDILDPEGASWKKFLENFTEEEFRRLIEVGSIAMAGLKLRIKNGARFGFEVDFEGHRSFAVNWSLESSEMGEYIYKDLGYEVAIVFYYTGKHWNFSLRSDKIDVSQLAARYGGGGHPGAAGFRRDSIDWLLELKKK